MLRSQWQSVGMALKKMRDDYFPRLHTDLWEDNQKVSDEIQEERSFSHKVAIFWAMGLGFVALWYFLFNTLDYLYLLVWAYIISLAMEGVVWFFSRITHRRWVWIAISYLLLFLFLLSGFLIIFPFIVGRGTEILNMIIGDLQATQAIILVWWLESYLQWIEWLPEFARNEILRYVESADTKSVLVAINDNLWNIVNISSSYLKTLWWYAMDIAGKVFMGAGKSMILLTLSVFFSISHFDVKRLLKYAFSRAKDSSRKIEEVYFGIASWLKSQLLLCLVIGVATYIGLWILSWIGFDLPQKWTLSLLAGLFEILPYLWPRMWAIPAVISALILFWFKGLVAVVILYIIIQQSEEKFFVPVVMNKTLGVNPLLVLVSMIFGGLTVGFLGVLLAVPLAVVCTIVFSVPKKGK